MDKGWKNQIRKIKGIGMALVLVLGLAAYEQVYAAAELPADATHVITASTVNSGSGKTYDITVGWGNMQFVYDYAVPTWDTEKFEYIENGVEGWKESGFDGTNNMVQITNKSNAEITVDLNVEITKGVFNAQEGADSVQGHFFDTNEHALQASKILTNLNNIVLEGVIDQMVLDSAEAKVDGEGKVIEPAGARVKTAYFAFSGTPDKSLNHATEVGSISLVFTDTTEATE